MKKILRQILSITLVVALLFSVVAVGANAETSMYYYYVDGGEAVIYGYDTSISGDVVIPSTLDGYPVTRIDYFAFEYCDSITSVTIPDSVMSIGDSAFEYCTGLTNVMLFDGLTSIGDYAFNGCSGLTSITIPDSVMSIGDYAFSDCSGLTSIAIPDSVISIGDLAFSFCSGLISITVDSDNTAYSSDEYGVLFNKDKTELIHFPADNARTDYEIPKTVTSIYDWAFYCCYGLTDISIPEGIIGIGTNTFWGCHSLTSITLPKSLQGIGYGAFRFCSGLTNITIPDGVKTIGESAFAGCTSLANVTIPDTVTEIGARAFYDCSGLTSITVDSANTAYSSDEYGVLFNKNKTELIQYPAGNLSENYEIPKTVKTIDYAAFAECTSLTNVIIPDGVTSIPNSAFSDCIRLTSITIPNSVTSIGDGAFLCCYSLTNMTIPDGVTSIGDEAFLYCLELPSVTIPDSVTSIGYMALSMCTGLTSITVDSANTAYSSDEYGALFDEDRTELIQYPASNASEKYVVPATVKTINEYAFASPYLENDSGDIIPGGNLKELIIQNGVTEIGDLAFACCASLGYVHFSSSISSVGNDVFYGTAAYICADTEDCYAKTYAEENDIEFKVCDGHDDVVSEEPTTQPEEPTTQPEEPTTQPEEPTTQPEEPTTQPEEPTTQPEEPTTQPEEPTTQPEEPTTQPEEPTTQPEEPTTKPEEPTTQPEEPTTKPEEPTTKPASPAPDEPTSDKEIIPSPTRSEISYGDAIVLHVDLAKIPEGGYVEWSADNDNFSYTVADDGTCTITPESSGDTTFTATIYDAEGNAVSTDSQTMTSKAGFFPKLIAFFKKLFNLTKVYPNFIAD